MKATTETTVEISRVEGFWDEMDVHRFGSAAAS